MHSGNPSAQSPAVSVDLSIALGSAGHSSNLTSGDLIRLHDYLFARIVALEKFLQDLDLVFPTEVQSRMNGVRGRFASDLEARLAKLGKEMVPRLI